MGGPRRFPKPPDFSAARQLQADFGVPGAARPNSDLTVAEADARMKNSVRDQDGNISQVNDRGLESDLQKNLQGLYLKAKKENINPLDFPEDWGQFIPPPELGHADMYMVNPYNTRGNHGIEADGAIDGRGHAAIGVTNGQRILEGQYGQQLGENIGRRFYERNKGGPKGLLNIDRDGPGVHLFSPAYIVRGESAPSGGASAYWDRLNRYAYLPASVRDDDFLNSHELTHATIEGRQGDPNNPLHGLPDWDAFSAALQGGIPNQANPALPWFIKRWTDPRSGRAEIAADWVLANRNRSAISGNPLRGDKEILGNLKKALTGDLIDDPTIQIGPRAGNEAHWQNAVEDAMRYYWHSPAIKSRNRDTLIEMLLDGSSTQDGHPKYPNA